MTPATPVSVYALLAGPTGVNGRLDELLDGPARDGRGKTLFLITAAGLGAALLLAAAAAVPAAVVGAIGVASAHGLALPCLG